MISDLYQVGREMGGDETVSQLRHEVRELKMKVAELENVVRQLKDGISNLRFMHANM